MLNDQGVRRTLIGMMACVALAALALAWSANYHVVRGGNGYTVYVVNTLTGSWTFCDQTSCRALPVT